MGNKEHTIDIRLWLAALALAFYLGRMMDHHKNNNDGSSLTSSPPPPPITAATMRTTTTINVAEPSSQHFSLDFKGASTEFLQSKDELIQAISNASKLLNNMEVKSVRCQDLLMPSSNTVITCLAVLDQGQISIQAWPQQNVLSVDVIQYGSASILPAVSMLQAVFGVNTTDKNDDAVSFWSLDYRGQDSLDNRHVESYWEVTNTMISKVKDVVLRDELQNGGVLEIWDVLDIDITINYEDAIAHNLQPGDPRWINNELAKPSRTAYLDGHAVVRTDAEQAFFQESFVHPALMALENPRMIAILGGPGSILYEILKCHTIESVTWLQPNEQLIQTIQEFIPQTFDCSDLQGRPDSCLEEGSTAPLKWVKQDAKDYFGGNNIANDNSVFDVIFSQLVKPHNADDLSSYVESVMKEGLSPDGALMLSLGQAPTVLHPRGDIGHFASYENLFRTLEGLDEVDSMTVFEEDFTLSGFTNEIVPETFLLVCKSAKCLERFHSKPEMIDLQLTGRYLSRLSNKPILEYYDGAVHSRMQVPPKAYETIYCRREPMPIECAYRSLDFSHSMYEFDASDLTRSAFEVLKEEEEDVRVVATVDIPEGSYIMAKDLSQSLLVSEASLGKVLSDDDGADSLASAGRVSLHGGSARSRVLEMGVPGLILTTETAEASNVGCWFCPQQSQRPKYSPVYDRHFGSFDSFLVATKAIAKGEELVRLLV